jgi:hypothetical protein
VESEKNKDTLPENLGDVMARSGHAIVSSIFLPKAPEELPGSPTRGGKGAKGKKSASAAASSANSGGGGSLLAETVSTKFRTQLTDLMDTISKTSVQYVRCIKPNPIKSSQEFYMPMVLDQLRCAGVIEAIRISRAGFPHKMHHIEFLERFALLAPSVFVEMAHCPTSGKKKIQPSVEACQGVLKLAVDSDKQKMYEVGLTRVYFKFGLLEYLQDKRAHVLNSMATRIERVARGFVKHSVYRRQRKAAIRIEAIRRMATLYRAYQKTLDDVITVQVSARPLPDARESSRTSLPHRRWCVAAAACGPWTPFVATLARQRSSRTFACVRFESTTCTWSVRPCSSKPGSAWCCNKPPSDLRCVRAIVRPPPITLGVSWPRRGRTRNWRTNCQPCKRSSRRKPTSGARWKSRIACSSRSCRAPRYGGSLLLPFQSPQSRVSNSSLAAGGRCRIHGRGGEYSHARRD